MSSATFKSDGYRFASPAEAVMAVRQELTALPVEQVGLAVARGRVLAERIVADRDSPALDVSAMDGFAVRMADLAAMAGAGLAIATGADSEARIGCAPIQMPASPMAVRIVTGAPIPSGAETVIRREDAIVEGGRVRLTTAPANVKPGTSIRRQGENARGGATIVPAGTPLTGAVVGALAAFGASMVPVHRRVRVAIISTGDELVVGTESPMPWQLRDSNGPSLAALLGDRAWIDVVRHEQVRDEAEAGGGLALALRHSLEVADAVLLSGGVSMGQRDFVPVVVESLGGRTLFHKLPQRPGKPMLAALFNDGTHAKPILGLPGNPVSVLATGRRLAIPILARLAGLPEAALATPMRMIEPDGASLELWWHRLVREELNADGAAVLRLVPPKSSGDIVAAAGAAGFVEIPPGARGPGPWPFFAWNY